MAAEPLPRRFTVAEYYRMGKAGILGEDDRVELIEGEIIQMPPIGDPHAWGVNRLNYTFVRGLGDRAIVAIQNPLRLSDLSEPVPDLVVMRPRPDGMRGPHSTAKDVLLIVEVSDTTLANSSEIGGSASSHISWIDRRNVCPADSEEPMRVSASGNCASNLRVRFAILRLR